MRNKNKYAELTERMREIERVQDMIDARLDPDRHTWHDHFEVCKKHVSQEAIDELKEVMSY